ncbi:fimbrial protein [Moellerella wisconsensis]|uniref:fimbrial protein n=1 Tax=Moellerella wisconsensis TaxID=158849 RepID=UPI0006996AF3|nr:fimbrial protein [Moellerella wisconsensis]
MKLKNKFIIAVLTTAAATSFTYAAGNQGQGSGKVKFHGYIIDAPCTVISQDPIEVEFGQISRKVLQLNNNTGESSIQPFAIELANCTFDEARKDGDDVIPGEYVDDKVSVTFSYGAAMGGQDENGDPITSDMIGFDGTGNMGAGIVIASNNTTVKNGESLPPQKLQTGPNTLGFTSYVKGLGIPDAKDTPSIQTGEFYATANFTLSYE